MSAIEYSRIEFNDNLFVKLNLAISKSEQKIAYIADGGINRSEAYNQAIRKFSNNIEKGLSENNIFTWKEILYVTNELVVNRHLFDLLVEYEEFETFILLLKPYKKLSIYKKLFHIYFNYYSTLNSEKIVSVFRMYLKSILRTYEGKNSYINKLEEIKEHLFEGLPKLLEHYEGNFEIIEKDIKLQDSFEFSKALLNLKVVEELKALAFDEENRELFETIIERKEMFFDKGLSLKEYVAQYLIAVAMKQNEPFPNWQLFILRLIGDPRSTALHSATMRSWDIVGEEEKLFFIKTLSKDDLKLFLEALSDSVSDTNYHYRKAFWMQFLDKVVFAKIMISSDAYQTMNDTMKEKFKHNNDSYGTLQGVHNQSAIYIDFGVIKIIEFTHSGQVRGFEECPIDLHAKHYMTKDLVALEDHNSHIFSERHASPRTYTWQQVVLEYLNFYLNTNVTKNDVEIPVDREKRERYSKKEGYN